MAGGGGRKIHTIEDENFVQDTHKSVWDDKKTWGVQSTVLDCQNAVWGGQNTMWDG